MIDFGGSIAFNSTRFTRIPHLPVASSRTAAQLAVDLLPRGQGPFEIHAADHVAQRCHGQLFERLDEIRDLIRRGPRVRDLEVQHRVDVHNQVVLGDHRLRRERHHLLTQVNSATDPVHAR